MNGELAPMENVTRILGAFVSFVFIQSLFFKFTNSIETQHIFGTLDAWAGTFGFAGIFSTSGLFSQYVIGTAELFAALLILSGMFYARFRGFQGLGALIGAGIISGAIFFHLFTPLGIEVQGDGGLLFAMAVGVWISCVTILAVRRHDLTAIVPGVSGAAL